MLFSILLTIIIITVIYKLSQKKDSKIQSHMYDNGDPVTIGSTPKVNTVNEKELHPIPSVSISVTTEISSSNDSGRAWDDITQEEIDSVKCSGDNMSMRKYEIRARYIPTNRMRGITVYAFNEDEAISQLSDDFIKESAIVTASEYPEPSDRQIQYAIYLGIHIPEKCSSPDISALISRKVDESAPSELVEFALSHKYNFSYYGDEPYLIHIISSRLATHEWIAFAIACMNKYITKTWDFSLWKDYLDYSSELMNNTSFMNSSKRIHKEFVGFQYENQNGNRISHDTIFYKTLHKYIIDIKDFNHTVMSE